MCYNNVSCLFQAIEICSKDLGGMKTVSSENNNENKDAEKISAEYKPDTTSEADAESSRKKTTLIVEIVIAVLAVAFIAVAIIIKKAPAPETAVSGPAASTNTVADTGDETLSVNSTVFDTMPDIPGADALNTLTADDCEKAVTAGTMLKLTAPDGATVYVNDYKKNLKDNVSVNEADIDDLVFERVTMYYGEDEPADHDVAALYDTVSINYAGKIDGVAFDGGTADDQVLTLGAGGYIDGFEDGILGMKVGETKDIDVTFPSDYGATDLAGKDAVFTITLNEIVSTTVYPELTDDMVNETTGGEITTVADLRDEFRKELMSESIWGFIGDEYYVSDFPAGEVEKLYTTNLTYYDQMATSSNMQLGDLLAMYGMSLDSLKNDIMQTSAQTIRDSVLYDAIGEDAGIKLTDDDILELAKEYGYDDIDVFLSDNAATRKQVESYIMRDRITDYMVSLVK